MNQDTFYQTQQTTVNEAAREHSETIFLKKFNNFIKQLLINQFTFQVRKLRRQKLGKNDLSVLDFCCGRGGDLRKWKNVGGGIDHYVGVDLSSGLIDEA